METRSLNSWEILVASAASLAAVVIPAELALSPPDGSMLRPWADFPFLEILLTVVFAADIPVRLKQGKVPLRWMIVDSLAAVPFSALPVSPVFQLVRLLKLARVPVLMREIWRRNVYHSVWLRLMFFQYWLVILTHWFSCGWLTLHGLAADDAWSNYLQSLYFVVTTLTTVGYGDVTAATNPERLFVIVMMFFGVAMYGYVIGNVASMLARVDSAQAHHAENIEKLNAFVKYKSLPLSLRKRLTEYYTYLWEQRLGYDESSVLDSLPPTLKTEVALHLKRDIIHKVPLFKSASEEFVREIAQYLMPVVFLPGDFIFRAGEAGSEMYFVSRGELDVISKDGQTVLSQLRDGDFFGEIALMLQEPRTASVQAKGYCDLYRLQRDVFERVLARYPEVQEKIQLLVKERKARG